MFNAIYRQAPTFNTRANPPGRKRGNHCTIMCDKKKLCRYSVTLFYRLSRSILSTYGLDFYYKLIVEYTSAF